MELTEVFGTGTAVVPSLPKCPIRCCTELTEVSATALNDCTDTGGSDIHIVPNLQSCPVSVWESYRAYLGDRYR